MSESKSSKPEAISAQAWAKMTPEDQKAVTAAFAAQAAASAKYAAKPSASVKADGTRSYGVRIAWPSYVTKGAAQWLLTDEGRKGLAAAIAALDDPDTIKALDEQADASLEKRAGKAKADKAGKA